MASHEVILWNIGMAIVVSLYVFGGDKPMVSQTTAVAVGILQIYSLLATAATSGVLQSQKKVKGCSDEEENPNLGSMARQCYACAASNIAKIVENSAFCRLGGMLAVLMVGRFLRTAGFMTTPCQAIPLALVFGALMSLAVNRIWPQQSDIEGDDDATEEYPLGGDKSPYSVAFWSELEPPGKADPIDSASLEPEEILSDVLYELYMK